MSSRDRIACLSCWIPSMYSGPAGWSSFGLCSLHSWHGNSSQQLFPSLQSLSFFFLWSYWSFSLFGARVLSLQSSYMYSFPCAYLPYFVGATPYLCLPVCDPDLYLDLYLDLDLYFQPSILPVLVSFPSCLCIGILVWHRILFPSSSRSAIRPAN